MTDHLRLEELRGLELLLSTIELGSISAAARRHFVSQPSATAQLRNLEARLGIELLERGAAGSAPTAAGRTVAAWAREVVGAAERFSAGIEALREASNPHLRIASSFTIAEYLLPRWLTEAHPLAATVPIDLEVGNSVTVADRVMSGAVDLGFIESPRDFPDLTSEVIGHDELVVVVARSHPWARKRKALSVAELLQGHLLLREPGSGTREFFEAGLVRAGGGEARAEGTLGTTTALKSAIAGGGSCTVLSQLAVIPELESGALIRIDVEGLELSRELRAVWRGEEPPQLAKKLLRVAREALSPAAHCPAAS